MGAGLKKAWLPVLLFGVNLKQVFVKHLYLQKVHSHLKRKLDEEN